MGRKIFFDTFNNNPYLHYVSVRDELSKEYWLNLFGGSVSVVPDPGNFAHEAYADVTSSDESVRVIGIGVMADDLVIKDTPGTHVKVALSIDDYMVLGNRLLELGYMPLYFTNGAPEDEVVLRGIKSIFPNSSQVKFAERPIIPADLVRIIRCCEKIVAHRLHACIVATSIGVPVIGLAWDKKLSSYFEGIGAVDRVCTDFEVDALVEKLLALEPVAIDFDKNSYIKLVS